MLYMIDGPLGATSLGYENPRHVQLVRPGASPVFLVDDLSVLVSDEVAESLRASCPTGLKLEEVVVWAAQPVMRKRADDRFLVSGKFALRLLPSLVEYRDDGSVKSLTEPFVLDEQALPGGVEVFVIAEHPRVVLFTEASRKVLRQHASRLQWEGIPFVNEPMTGARDPTR